MKPVILTAGITLSPKTVLSLAAAHIGHYSEQIDLCGRGIRVDEARYYKKLWTEIRSAVTLGGELGSEHVQELHDAATSGDYDVFLNADEFRAVNRPAKAAS